MRSKQSDLRKNRSVIPDRGALLFVSRREVIANRKFRAELDDGFARNAIHSCETGEENLYEVTY